MSPDEKEKLLEKMDAEMDEQIHCWQDLFDKVCLAYEVAIHLGNGPALSNAVIVANAFAKALQQLPEEGDAKVIAKRMNRVLMDGDASFGNLLAEYVANKGIPLPTIILAVGNAAVLDDAATPKIVMGSVTEGTVEEEVQKVTYH